MPCCFTSTETIRTIKDGESRTATSTFTQHLSSATSMLLHATETVRTVKDGELLSSVKKEPMLRLIYASNTLCGNVSDVLMTLLFFLYHDSVETSAGRGLYRNTCDLSVKPLNHNSIPCSSHPSPPPQRWSRWSFSLDGHWFTDWCTTGWSNVLERRGVFSSCCRLHTTFL